MSLLMNALQKSVQGKQQQDHHSAKQTGKVAEPLLDSEALEKELESIMAASHERSQSVEIESQPEEKIANSLDNTHLSLALNLIDDTTVQEQTSQIEEGIPSTFQRPVENTLLRHNNDGKPAAEARPTETLQDEMLHDKSATVTVNSADAVNRATADHLLQAGKQPVARQKNKYRGYGLLALVVILVVGIGGGYVYYELNARSFTPVFASPSSIDLSNSAPLLALATMVDDMPTENPFVSLQKTEVKQSTADISSVKKAFIRQETKPVKQKISGLIASTVAIKRERPDSIHTLLLAGYNAYQRKDMVIAHTYYRTVLQRKNKNRDAMLGLAAIALREKNHTIAQDYYTRLLRVNPSDSVARGGLVSLLGELAPLQAESELKILLNQEPGAAYLHFTLGNIYVSQSRWADAQQAFFNAYSAGRDNADYAYNLAISLDFLGEHKTALNYYREALTLAERSTMGFALSAVENRIHRLLRIVGG